MVIQCMGAQLRNGRIGPFSLSPGKIISVSWRYAYPGWSDDLQAIVDALQGNLSIPGFSVLSPFRVVDIWSTKPSKKKVARLLSSNSPEDVARFSRTYNVSLNAKFVDLSGTPRTLVTLESARKDNDAVCLVLGGLDPLGIATVQEYLAAELREHAVLELFVPTTNLPERLCQNPLVEVVQR
jgi:hypothetical protein